MTSKVFWVTWGVFWGSVSVCLAMDSELSAWLRLFTIGVAFASFWGAYEILEDKVGS